MGLRRDPPDDQVNSTALTTQNEDAGPAGHASNLLSRPSQENCDNTMFPNSSREASVPEEQRNGLLDPFFDEDKVFSNITPVPGFTLGSNFMDFNLDAEGMDFIPLPMIDASMLSAFPDASQTDPLNQWQQLSFVTEDDGMSKAENEDQASSPSVNEDNRRLVQHYLDVMKGYSKVDEPSKDANNLFISAFSRSLSFPPLFSAILAFSAAHLSIQDPSYINQATILDRAAQESTESFQRDHELEVEGLLSALFIRAKKIHVMGDDAESFLAVITDATAIISTDQGQKALHDSSTLTRRIILRLAILDARAACYRLGGGVLVNRLRSMNSLSDIFCSNRTPETVASPGPVASLLRANVFRMQVGELDTRLHKQLTDQFVTPPVLKVVDFTSLATEIQYEIELWDRRLSTHGLRPYAGYGTENDALDSTEFGSYTVLSVLHSALLYLNYIFVRDTSHQEFRNASR